ncbi:cytochrome P450 71D9-like [Ziziphus jujuba]|uniref:Cytochrome P450 71D9-like n=1 Tax=Ziziphus jujuba TaxID=326968 RepID=A0ABM3I2U7_ZIZJJ|nr:cytochrome P450 71D9-like [Ziziphus jujuba]XP_060667684.1 cytochrome P450 71D9-like [Ziziphus jujuba]
MQPLKRLQSKFHTFIMELQIPSFPILFAFFLLLLMVLNISKRPKTRNSSSTSSKLPPGPWKLPIIGNMHQLVGSLPHRGLRDLAKKHGPLMHLKLGEVSTIVVSSPEIAKEVMKTHDINFASRPQIIATKIMSYDSTNLIFAPYGEYWRQLRKICLQELLSISQVQSFQPIREEELSILIKWIAFNAQSGSAINLTQKIFATTYNITARAAFGKRCKDQEKFISVLEDSITEAGGFDIADLFPSVGFLHYISGTRPKLERLHREADMILETIINEHRKDKAKCKTDDEGKTEEDLVDVLLKFHDRSDNEFSLTSNNIKAVIMDVFGAGSETSSTTVDWTMSEMIKNPRIMKKAQEEVRQVFKGRGSVDETGLIEMKYLKLVIKEALRLHPPAPLLLPRECRESCEINGYGIPLKTKVIVNAWAIGRDPRYWKDPESFVPERFIDSSVDFKGANFEYIPFGAGRRICPGILFGLINIELPLALLLYHFDWKLPSGMKHEGLDMTESFGITVRRKDDLQVIPIAYHDP